MQLGQHPSPTHSIAHLSDPHLLANGVRQYGVVDTEQGLRQALKRLAHVTPRPQALIFTGDLADKAEPEAYVRLREVVEPAAADLGAEVIWTMGNHDERAVYSRALFGIEPDDPEATQDRVHEVEGLRIISLDTSVPGYHHGELSAAQLAWLADVLATPAPYGTVLAMHHPPVPTPMLRAAELIELADQHLLAEVLRGTDVRTILAGHLHYSTYSTFAGIPVSVASASCYSSDPAPVERFLSGVDGHQSFTMMHVYDDRVVQTIVPLAEVPELTGFPSDVVAQLEALTPEERREHLSRKDSEFNTDLESHQPR